MKLNEFFHASSSGKSYSEKEAKWYENLEFSKDMGDDLSLEEVLEDYGEKDAKDLKSAIKIAGIESPKSLSGDSVSGTNMSISKLLKVSSLLEKVGRHEVRSVPTSGKKFVYTDEDGMDCIWC